MTEQEWMACSHPTPMLGFLRGQASDRKLRLFSVACCRRVWSLFALRESREAVECSDLFADGRVKVEVLAVASQWACDCITAENSAFYDTQGEAGISPDFPCIDTAAYLASATALDPITAARDTADTICDATPVTAKDAERFAQTQLLRCVFGNPFRSVTPNPGWLTPTVTNLAAAAYEERSLPSGELASARLAVLADALEDAGCENAEVLDHLRSPGPHFRGCWVVDLLTGRSCSGA